MADLTVQIKRYGHTSGHPWWDDTASAWVETRPDAGDAATLPEDADFSAVAVWAGEVLADGDRGDETLYVLELTDGESTDVLIVPVVDDASATAAIGVVDGVVDGIAADVTDLLLDVAAVEADVDALAIAVDDAETAILDAVDEVKDEVRAAPTRNESVTYTAKNVDGNPVAGTITTDHGSATFAATYDGQGHRATYTRTED